jgi:hypothetical protein
MLPVCSAGGFTLFSFKKIPVKRIFISVIAVLLIGCLFVVLRIALNFNIFSFLQNLFYLKYLPKLGSNTSFWLLFVVGLLTSIHCMGMCGGIMLTQTLKKKEDEAASSKPKAVVLPAALYNLGRVCPIRLSARSWAELGRCSRSPMRSKGSYP